MTGFRHLSDVPAYQGHIWHVALSEFSAPDGVTFRRDIVRSPGAVAAVPLRFDQVDEPSVVLVRQYRAAFDSLLLEIPAGMRDVADEPTVETAQRELIEEVGFRAGSLRHLTNFYPSPGMTDAVLHLFLATDLVPVGRETHGPEEDHSEVVELPFAHALEMVVTGEIVDAKTVIGLLFVDRELRRGGVTSGR
ncbi:MAG: putative ADP-ribose pyrophosphatase [Actinomycetota bacterium]|jgi:ADP-ribose pyrophosphatase